MADGLSLVQADFVYAYAYMIVTHTQHFAVTQRIQAAAIYGFSAVFRIHAIGAGVFQKVASVAAMHAGMLAGQLPLSVRQGPVVIGAPADGAAPVFKPDGAVSTQRFTLCADDLQ